MTSRDSCLHPIAYRHAETGIAVRIQGRPKPLSLAPTIATASGSGLKRPLLLHIRSSRGTSENCEYSVGVPGALSIGDMSMGASPIAEYGGAVSSTVRSAGVICMGEAWGRGITPAESRCLSAQVSHIFEFAAPCVVGGIK